MAKGDTFFRTKEGAKGFKRVLETAGSSILKVTIRKGKWREAEGYWVSAKRKRKKRKLRRIGV